MDTFHCKGRETRIQLVKIYDIVPISHTSLLKGQVKHSAAEHTITKEYYCFSYKKKGTTETLETFIVGIRAAKHFLELLNHEPIPIFNPLKSNLNNSRYQENKHIETQKEKWNPLAWELYTVINIILMAWDKNITILSEILTKISNNKNAEPSLSNIKSVNTIISKDYKKRTIDQMLDEFRIKNDIKDFKFPLIMKILSDSKIENHITSRAYER